MMINMSYIRVKFLPFYLLISAGCTTVTIEEVQHTEATLVEGESVVVIGRRTSNDYETEPELISCIGKVLSKGDNQLNVIPEQTFMDNLYPWFEPRTAPLRVRDLQRLLAYDAVSQKFDDFNVHYIIWIDGNTETTRSSGSITCSLGTGGIGCFGFGTWDKKAEYEASIWDYKNKKLIGKVSSEADGTSYMPAIVIPIPIIAQVQADACKGMAVQLKHFFNNSQG
ncbi:hypothetical protein SAMN02745724_00654 [Pseudoalteromonas denitrificans DSM 6059]|jgi:hypothetical protein|uniref:Uncharacterized protein n=2 Tax=Pseudoalteromonas TaxID=53246 RepID=A0A1I1FIT5_9GAMM|nr:hypothetical protein SAMN02745724_00654 [Pseudoalteromonas denitrificans DSM 6059]